MSANAVWSANDRFHIQLDARVPKAEAVAMWIALLVGLGVGLMGLFVVQVRLQRDLRTLLSDAHLTELVAKLEALAAGKASGEVTTFAGLALSLAGDGVNRRLWLRSGRGVPPVGIPWVVAVVSVIADVPPTATRTDKTHVWLAWPETEPRPLDMQLGTLRAAAADRLRDVRVG